MRLYVEEAGSDDVRGLVSKAVVVATSVVAYAQRAPRLRGCGAAAISGPPKLVGASDTRFSSFDDRLNKAARDVSRRLEAGL